MQRNWRCAPRPGRPSSITLRGFCSALCPSPHARSPLVSSFPLLRPCTPGSASAFASLTLRTARSARTLLAGVPAHYAYLAFMIALSSSLANKSLNYVSQPVKVRLAWGRT